MKKGWARLSKWSDIQVGRPCMVHCPADLGCTITGVIHSVPEGDSAVFFMEVPSPGGAKGELREVSVVRENVYVSADWDPSQDDIVESRKKEGCA